MRSLIEGATVHLPTIGLKLETGRVQLNNRANFYLKTTSDFVATGYCMNCGAPFFVTSYGAKYGKRPHFCSNSCRAKFVKRKLKEANLRLACKNTDHKEFEKFYKHYNGYVMALIYEQKSELWEDLKDYWQEYAIRHFYNITKWEQAHGRKANRYAYFKKDIHFRVLNALKKRENEVFYDECNIKPQQMILGNCNYE